MSVCGVTSFLLLFRRRSFKWTRISYCLWSHLWLLKISPHQLFAIIVCRSFCALFLVTTTCDGTHHLTLLICFIINFYLLLISVLSTIDLGLSLITFLWHIMLRFQRQWLCVRYFRYWFKLNVFFFTAPEAAKHTRQTTSARWPFLLLAILYVIIDLLFLRFFVFI